MYDFDQVINRLGTDSLKWDTMPADNVLPMWVADMDIAVAPPIVEALQKRLEHPIFGYAIASDPYYEAAIGFFKRWHGLSVKKEWFAHASGIVSALHVLAKGLKPDEKIMMCSPVYYPFFAAANRNNIQVEFCDLIYNRDKCRYYLDEQAFAKIAGDPKVKLFFLCSPHNPGGRVWTKEELEVMCRICCENSVLIVSDEIHCDLSVSDCKHVPTITLSEEIANNSITFLAPSKTFNLAGLQTSLVIIPNPDIKAEFVRLTQSCGIMRPNTFGVTALTAAYSKCDDWLTELNVYLRGNIDYFCDFIRKNIPGIKVMRPEAGYLIWFDFRDLHIAGKAFHKMLLDEGRLWLDEGYIFGETGEGFERINIACPRKLLEEGCQRLLETVNLVKSQSEHG